MFRTLLLAFFSVFVASVAHAEKPDPGAAKPTKLHLQLEALVAQAQWSEAAKLATLKRGPQWCTFGDKQHYPDNDKFRTLAVLGLIGRHTDAPEQAVDCLLESFFRVENDHQVARALFDLGVTVEKDKRAAKRLHHHLDELTANVEPRSHINYVRLQHYSTEAIREVRPGPKQRATARALYRGSFDFSPTAAAARRGALSASEVQARVGARLPQPFAVSHRAASLEEAKAWAVREVPPKNDGTRWYRETWNTVHMTDALVLQGLMLFAPADPEEATSELYGSKVIQVVIVKPAKSSTYYVLVDPTVYHGPDRGSAVITREIHDLNVTEDAARVAFGTYGMTSISAHSTGMSAEESAIACDVPRGAAPVCVHAHVEDTPGAQMPLLYEKLDEGKMQFKLDAMSPELRAALRPYHGASVETYLKGLSTLNRELGRWVQQDQ